MPTDKQIAANRRNAQHSTGPRTPAGKAAVARNALKHGLLSRDALLPGEDLDEFAAMAQRLRAELQPQGELEEMLVDRICGAIWRLRRLGRIEAGLLVWEYYAELQDRAARKASALPEIDIYSGVVPGHDHHQAQADEAGSRRESDLATLGRAFARDAMRTNAFTKLSRYEAAIERSLFRALHELQRLQAVRQGAAAPLPVAVDLDVAVAERG